MTLTDAIKVRTSQLQGSFVSAERLAQAMEVIRTTKTPTKNARGGKRAAKAKRAEVPA